MKIEVGKEYVTRGGDVALIDQAGFPDELGSFYEFLGVCDGIRHGWRRDGAYNYIETSLDLVRERHQHPAINQQPANFNITITIQAETPEGYRAALTALGEGV